MTLWHIPPPARHNEMGIVLQNPFSRRTGVCFTITSLLRGAFATISVKEPTMKCLLYPLTMQQLFPSDGNVREMKRFESLTRVESCFCTTRVKLFHNDSTWLKLVSEMTSSGHSLIWWGGAMSICNPMLHRTILRKSITFANVHLWGNSLSLV